MKMTEELDEIMGWTTTSYEGEEAWEIVDGRMSGTDYKLALLRLQGAKNGIKTKRNSKTICKRGKE